jgi:uncharacterized protein YukE
MDPLIELPDAAKARIKARQAEADDLFNRVVQACERDIAAGQNMFGGYLDLHEDELRAVIEAANSRVDEAKLICARSVFVAHGNEYLHVHTDAKELESLLSKLREAVIKQYGERLRTAIQCKEAQLLERAVADSSERQKNDGEPGGPELVGAASFWRACRTDFRDYNTEENRSLLADWDSMTDCWSFRGPSEAEAAFKSLASIAAKGFETYNEDEPWRSWLEELRRRRRSYKESQTTATYSQRAMEDTSKFGVQPPTVKGELKTGTVDYEEMEKLFGQEIAESKKGSSFVQTRFEGVHGVLKNLFDESGKLCLEFESWAPNPTTPSALAERVKSKSNEGDVVPANQTIEQLIPEWASNLKTPGGRKLARDAWKKHWTTPERECTNDDLTETAFSQRDRPFLNQWENGNVRLKDPARSTRVQGIERVLRGNTPPKWHPAAKQTRA